MKVKFCVSQIVLLQAEAFAEEAAKAEDNEDAVLMHAYTLLCSGQTANALTKLSRLHHSL